MTSTARQLRQPPTIEAIERVLYFADVLNPMLVEHEIDIGDKEPSFRPLYNLLENELVVLR